MAKSKPRKKYIQRDAAGHPLNSNTKRHARSIGTKQMMRKMQIQQACAGHSSEEIEIYIDHLKETSKGTLKYVTTTLDDNGVPVSGETKQIKLCRGDINTLETTLRLKKEEETKVKSLDNV